MGHPWDKSAQISAIIRHNWQLKEWLKGLLIIGFLIVVYCDD
jgi:hypothetical protein